MRVDITGRHVDITPPLRQLIDRSLGKVERLLNDRAVSATVILTKEKYRHKTELVVHARGDHMLSGNGEGNGWPLSVRKAAAKTAGARGRRARAHTPRARRARRSAPSYGRPGIR
jgi:ribosomal subunit interface protein